MSSPSSPSQYAAARYTGIESRGSAGAVQAVRSELAHVIDAPPTALRPEERASYLAAIIDDLEPAAGAWHAWPQDPLALTAVKVLGRNPVGSADVLLGDNALAVLAYHTALPLAESADLPSRPPDSDAALEALRALANTLVLHAAARPRAAALGLPAAIARALRDDNIPPARLFLICRVGFLITTDAEGSAVGELVDAGAVPRLAHYLRSLSSTPPHYDALGELLKLTGNVLRAESFKWSQLEPLHAPLLSVVYALPLTDLVPPLTHALHALLGVPCDSETEATWHSPPSSLAQNIVSVSSEPSAFPRRLLEILGAFAEIHLRPGTRAAVPLNDVLPPVFMLGLKTAALERMRKAYHAELFPRDLDRSEAAGPLESRATLLGALLRLLSITGADLARDTAGDFLLAIAGGPAQLCDEVGYGVVAGVLFRHGMSGPPPAHIEEVDEVDNETGVSASSERHPITGLERGEPTPSAFAGMSEEEREREAEKMFVLFERLQRNPALSAAAPTADGGTQSIRDAMAERVAAGDADAWERKEAQRLREEHAREEEEDERDAIKEMEAYRQRRGGNA